ncbi:hypothetical protein X798_07626, partial [Onchocerca flexuosa]
MKKCQRTEFHVIIYQKNMSQETSEIVEKLESKVQSMQKIFNNTMNRIEIESIRREKLRVTYKVDAELRRLTHPFDSDKVRMSAFVRYVQKRLQINIITIVNIHVKTSYFGNANNDEDD